MAHQGSLFPTLEESVIAGQEAIAERPGLEPLWNRLAKAAILSMSPGRCFLAEDVVEQLAEAGYLAPDARAIGGVVQRLARAGCIERTGKFRPARSSHGSPKPEWRRAFP